MDKNQSTIFIGNLPFSTTEDDLKRLFESFGTIVKIHIPTNRETGQPRGFAFLEFSTEESAQAALAADGQDVNGRAMKVSIALGKKESTFKPRTGGNRFGGSSDRRGGSMGGGFSRDRNKRY
ncbi:RNA-binding protein [Candidatus Dependentiae bacterium]|nr:RNA-binding protein [Candidatus Dependentiae bacterium]